MIYFVRLNSGAIKIGCSSNIKVRLLALRSTYASGNTLLKTMEGGPKEEQQIHERFSHLRFGRKEQFRPGPDLMEFIGLPPVENHELVAAVHSRSPNQGRGKRVMLYLDRIAIDRLDSIVAQVPDIDNRSAAIRYVSRVALEELEKSFQNLDSRD